MSKCSYLSRFASHELSRAHKHKLSNACRSLNSIANFAFFFEDHACSNVRALENFYYDFMQTHRNLASCYAKDAIVDQNYNLEEFASKDEENKDNYHFFQNELFNAQQQFYLAIAGVKYDLNEIAKRNCYPKLPNEEDTGVYFVNDMGEGIISPRHQNLIIDYFLRASIGMLDMFYEDQAPKKTFKYSLIKASHHLEYIPPACGILNDQPKRSSAKTLGQILFKDVCNAVLDIICNESPLLSSVTLKAHDSMQYSMQYNISDEVNLINTFQDLPHIHEYHKANNITGRIDQYTLEQLHQDNVKFHKIIMSLQLDYLNPEYHHTVKTQVIGDCCQLNFDKQFNDMLSPVLVLMLNKLLHDTNTNNLFKVKDIFKAINLFLAQD